MDAARRARRFTTEVCARWRVAQLAPDAAVVVTELVENTLRHTRMAPRLALELHRDELTVRVTDDDPGEAIMREGGHPPGLGLLLVAQTSREWGCERVPPGAKRCGRSCAERAAGGAGPPLSRTAGAPTTDGSRRACGTLPTRTGYPVLPSPTGMKRVAKQRGGSVRSEVSG